MDKNESTCTNTDGWGNKLVTIFARYPDSFILTKNISIIYLTRDFGSWQILPLENFIFRRDGKNCAIPSLHRDSFLAKVSGSWPDAASGNVYSLNRRAVSGHGILIFL
jgi:hypothetical protein